VDRPMPAPMAAPVQPGVPPVPQMVDQAMGRFNPQAAAGATDPDAVATRTYTDAMAAGNPDPRAAAKEAWKAAVAQAADPTTPDEPGSENLRALQAQIQKTQRVDAVTAYALARQAMPLIAQQGGQRG